MTTSKTMVAEVKDYLAYRRKLGYQLRIEGEQLLSFAKYADASGHCGPITLELVLKWAALPQNVSQLYRARRVEVVRCFARYRAIFDRQTQIPPGGILGCAHRRTAPYIYSQKEITQLLKAARKLKPPDGVRPRSYATLFGLLACTGLRVSEALKLNRDDVKFDQSLLHIRESKFRKSRLVPIHPTAKQALYRYAEFRDQYCPLTESKAFFISQAGKPLCYSTVNSTFTKIRAQLDWNIIHGRRKPRLGDLRHTFACHRLLLWYQEGVDVNHAIATLSTYLGHAKVSDTYWYLTGIPELLSVAVAKFQEFARKI
jgi:integrase